MLPLPRRRGRRGDRSGRDEANLRAIESVAGVTLALSEQRDTRPPRGPRRRRPRGRAACVWRACSASRARRAIPRRGDQAAREISTALDAELDELGRRAFSMLEIPRRAPGDRQAGRPPQLPDQLHAKPVEARRRGGLSLRDDGRRAGARSPAGAPRGADARHRQGAHPRARRITRGHRRRLRAPPRRGRDSSPTPSARTTPTSRSTAPTPTWWPPPTRMSGGRPGARRQTDESYLTAHRRSGADHARLPRRRRGLRRAGRPRGSDLRARRTGSTIWAP